MQLIATGVCGSDTIEQTIVIEGQAPAPDFTTDVNGGCAPVTIQFTDESDGNPTAWSWSFPGGTPATSTEQNPVVTYENAGIYGVELTVSNAFGTENLSVAPVVFVDDLPQAAFTYQTSLLQVDFVVTGAQVGVSYHWEFGDGATGDGPDVGHEYSGPGSYTVKLIAANDCGESTTTQEVQLIIDATTDQDKPANQLHLYPNPNDGQFTLKGELYGEQVALLTIFNAIGQKIDQRIKQVVQNRLEERYHFEQLPAGVYYLVVEVNAKTYYLKFVTV
ncbi:MAG: PKD domain-containing protein [Saprospiraceae bacterium]|nr:PKD domain-containing protein [Saprospiraceae bacterium]